MRGLYGELAAGKSRWQDAEAELRAALALLKNVENHWRVKWTLDRLAHVVEALGRNGEAARLREEARRLARQMGLPDGLASAF